MTQLIPLPDGRTLAVDDHGTSTGPVVVFLPSAPGSRLLDPDRDATAAAEVRLLTVDRPGCGASSPMPDGEVPTLGSIADDVAHAVTSLGVETAAVVGWSAGGRVALAVAARHPALVRTVAVVGTPAPDEAVPWVPAELREMVPAVRADPPAAVPMLATDFAAYPDSPDQAVASVTTGPADERALADPQVREQIIEMVVEAVQAAPAGAAADVIAINMVPDEPVLRQVAGDVRVPVRLFFGDADAMAGPEHGRWWQQVIPDAELTIVPGAGHLVVLAAWEQILDAVKLG